MREAMDQCHKCKKKIRGKIVYSGGRVWHPDCYPDQKALQKARKRKARRERRRKR